MDNFLFAFNFTERIINDYIIDFSKKKQLDFYYLYPGVIVSDLYGTNQYYKVYVKNSESDRKEVYFCTDEVYHCNGLE